MAEHQELAVNRASFALLIALFQRLEEKKIIKREDLRNIFNDAEASLEGNVNQSHVRDVLDDLATRLGL